MNDSNNNKLNDTNNNKLNDSNSNKMNEVHDSILGPDDKSKWQTDSLNKHVSHYGTSLL